MGWSPGLQPLDVQDLLNVEIIEGAGLVFRVELRALVLVSFPAHESLWVPPPGTHRSASPGSQPVRLSPPQTGLTVAGRARMADLKALLDSSDSDSGDDCATNPDAVLVSTSNGRMSMP